MLTRRYRDWRLPGGQAAQGWLCMAWAPTRNVLPLVNELIQTAARIELHLAYNNVSLYVTFKRLLPRVSFCLSMGCLRALTISMWAHASFRDFYIILTPRLQGQTC